MELNIGQGELVSRLDEDNKLLWARVEANKERINDLERKLEYSSKIILLYENVIKYSKQEAKNFESELKTREHLVESARDALAKACDMATIEDIAIETLRTMLLTAKDEFESALHATSDSSRKRAHKKQK